MSVRFDDPNLVSCGGLAAVLALATRCGLATLLGERLRIAAKGGAKVLASAVVPLSPRNPRTLPKDQQDRDMSRTHAVHVPIPLITGRPPRRPLCRSRGEVRCHAAQRSAGWNRASRCRVCTLLEPGRDPIEKLAFERRPPAGPAVAVQVPGHPNWQDHQVRMED
jgi:hypothetical protein